jgi:hypothetical protein
VEAAAEASNDVVGRAFWWSNCIQLRWMLWAMSHGGSLDNSDLGIEIAPAVDDFDWVMQACLFFPWPSDALLDAPLVSRLRDRYSFSAWSRDDSQPSQVSQKPYRCMCSKATYSMLFEPRLNNISTECRNVAASRLLLHALLLCRHHDST